MLTFPLKRGEFTLLRKIGEGGMAEVFLAEREGDEDFKTLVALKRLHGGFALDQYFIRQLVQEARLLGQLQHANVVRVHDLRRIEDEYYIVMEYIDGIDLAQAVQVHRDHDLRIPLSIFFHVALSLCEALDFAHSATDMEGKPIRLIHRDIKPSNALISNRGIVKLTDFGIARVGDTSNTGSVVKGTANYMSPEQASGEQHLTPASDIFSLGAVFWEMLTLEKLVEGNNYLTVINSIKDLNVGLKDITKKGIEPGLRMILLRMLARKRELRYQSMSLVLKDLRFVAEQMKVDLSPSHLREYMAKITNLARDAARRMLQEGNLATVAPRSDAGEGVPEPPPAMASSSASSVPAPASQGAAAGPAAAPPPELAFAESVAALKALVQRSGGPSSGQLKAAPPSSGPEAVPPGVAAPVAPSVFIPPPFVAGQSAPSAAPTAGMAATPRPAAPGGSAPPRAPAAGPGQGAAPPRSAPARSPESAPVFVAEPEVPEELMAPPSAVGLRAVQRIADAATKSTTGPALPPAGISPPAPPRAAPPPSVRVVAPPLPAAAPPVATRTPAGPPSSASPPPPPPPRSAPSAPPPPVAAPPRPPPVAAPPRPAPVAGPPPVAPPPRSAPVAAPPPASPRPPLVQHNPTVAPPPLPREPTRPLPPAVVSPPPAGAGSEDDEYDDEYDDEPGDNRLIWGAVAAVVVLLGAVVWLTMVPEEGETTALVEREADAVAAVSERSSDPTPVPVEEAATPPAVIDSTPAALPLPSPTPAPRPVEQPEPTPAPRVARAEPISVREPPTRTEPVRREPTRAETRPTEPRSVARSEPTTRSAEPAPTRTTAATSNPRAAGETSTKPSASGNGTRGSDLRSPYENQATPAPAAAIPSGPGNPTLVADYGERARRGKLEPTEIQSLRDIQPSQRDFEPSRAVLLAQYEAVGDKQGHCAVAVEVLAQSGNYADPQWNLEMGKCHLREGRYQQALETSRVAELQAQDIPAASRTDRQLKIWEVQAKAYKGLYQQTENLDYLADATAVWKRYQHLAANTYRSREATSAEEAIQALQDLAEGAL